jgi:molybdate transport system substrate-binding protein
MNSHMWRGIVMAAVLSLGGPPPATAAEIKVLTAGAFKQVVLALVPGFEKHTGHKVTVDNDTAGAAVLNSTGLEPAS